MTRPLTLLAAGAALGLLLAAPAAAQQRMQSPMPSPRASVSQTVGITEISVTYSRPGVKGRAVFGADGVVPMDDPSQPWRAGADENTVVSFEHDVTVEGKPLAAGSYGLHMYPKSDGAWTVIFSHVTDAWGSYTYNPAEDALRVQITPERVDASQEWMQFEFTNLEKNGATLVLAWDTLRLPIDIGVDTDALMVEYLREDYLRGYGFWNGEQYTSAASWCLSNDVNHQEALSWAERGVQMSPDFRAWYVKAGLEAELDKSDAAIASYEQALELAPSEQAKASVEQQLAELRG